MQGRKKFIQDAIYVKHRETDTDNVRLYEFRDRNSGKTIELYGGHVYFVESGLFSYSIKWKTQVGQNKIEFIAPKRRWDVDTSRILGSKDSIFKEKFENAWTILKRDERILDNLESQIGHKLDSWEFPSDWLAFFGIEVVYPLFRVYGDAIQRIKAKDLTKYIQLARYDLTALTFGGSDNPGTLDVLSGPKLSKLQEYLHYELTPIEQAAITLYTTILLKNQKEGHTYTLVSQIKEGFTDAVRVLEFLEAKGSIHILEGAVFTHEILEQEEHLRRAMRIIHKRVEKDGPLETVETLSEEDVIRLDRDQKKALEIIQKNPICILSGKAGTGKTTTMTALLSIYPLGCAMAMAPTNKAVRVLKNQTGSARTVHKALRHVMTMKPEDRAKIEFLIIDETSMLGLKEAALALYCIIKLCPGLRKLLFTGDTFQLPPVGAGDVLYDLSQCYEVAELTINHRTDAEILHRNAMRIREGGRLEDNTFGIELHKDHCVLSEPHPVNDRVSLEMAVSRDVDKILRGVGNNDEPLLTSPLEFSIFMCPWNKGVDVLNTVLRRVYHGERPMERLTFGIGDVFSCTKPLSGMNVRFSDQFKILSISSLGDEFEMKDHAQVLISEADSCLLHLQSTQDESKCADLPGSLFKDHFKRVKNFAPVSETVFVPGDKLRSLRTTDSGIDTNGIFILRSIMIKRHDRRTKRETIVRKNLPSTGVELKQGQIMFMRLYDVDNKTEMDVSCQEMPPEAWKLAFATTPHRMQGGESRECVYYIPANQNLWLVDRRNFYTFFTRASKKVILFMTHKALAVYMEKPLMKRRSLLWSHIKEEKPLLDLPDISLRQIAEKMNVFASIKRAREDPEVDRDVKRIKL